MKKATKDSANSYKQLQWSHAVGDHCRYSELIKNSKNSVLLPYWEKKKNEIEAKFPMLKN